MRDEIKTLFPELDEIRDDGLRAKVIDVWEDAIKTGGWTPSELEEIPFTLLAGDEVEINIDGIGALVNPVVQG